MRKLYINGKGHEKRVAVVEKNQLVECLYEREEEKGKVGSIYCGRVTKVLKGMNAAFVEVGLEKMGYLHVQECKEGEDDIAKTIHEGQWLIVQIIKEAVDEKGPKLSEKIELANEYGVYKPYEQVVTMSKKIRDEDKRKQLKELGQGLATKEDGFIFRTAAGEVALELVEEEMKKLQQQFQQLIVSPRKVALVHGGESFVDRLLKEFPQETIEEVVGDDFEMCQQLKQRVKHVSYQRGKDALASFEKEIESALGRIVWLKNGAYLIVEQMETMTVIDVNTGKFTGKTNQQETNVKTNEWAAMEIARQLRLRNIGGMILIDFINMNREEDKKHIRSVFIEAVKEDRSHVRAFHFTMLGLLEVTRKRKQEDMRSYVSQRCDVCYGRGVVKSAQTLAYELERELLFFHEEAVLIECSEDVKESYNTILAVNQGESVSGMSVFFEIQYSPLPFYRIKRVGSVEQCKRN